MKGPTIEQIITHTIQNVNFTRSVILILNDNQLVNRLWYNIGDDSVICTIIDGIGHIESSVNLLEL